MSVLSIDRFGRPHCIVMEVLPDKDRGGYWWRCHRCRVYADGPMSKTEAHMACTAHARTPEHRQRPWRCAE